MSGLLGSQWTSDLAVSQAMSLEGSEGAVCKGPLLCGTFHAHLFTCVWAFRGQLWLRNLMVTPRGNQEPLPSGFSYQPFCPWSVGDVVCASLNILDLMFSVDLLAIIKVAKPRVCQDVDSSTLAVCLFACALPAEHRQATPRPIPPGPTLGTLSGTT